jgi:hypothetical protein
LSAFVYVSGFDFLFLAKADHLGKRASHENVIMQRIDPSDAFPLLHIMDFPIPMVMYPRPGGRAENITPYSLA